MPGFCLVHSENGTDIYKDRAEASAFCGSRDRMQFEWKILVAGERLVLGHNRHEHHTAIDRKAERFSILVDGLVYGKDERAIIGELDDIAASVFIRGGESDDLIRSWTNGTDGEYAVILIDRETDDFILFNDRLGRLPVYYSLNADRIVVSRNPYYILNISDRRDFDKRAVSQYLLFGYSLGERTLSTGIRHLKGNSVIQSRKIHGRSRVTNLFEYDFDEKAGGSRQISEHADNVIDLIREACSERVEETYGTVLALSGGLDSRTVALCLKGLGVDFSATTFVDRYGIVEPDVESATRIAETLDIEQKITRMPRASGVDVFDLLRLKCGTNFLGMSFSIPLIHDIMKQSGRRITLFTGDGGDRVLRDTQPVTKVRSLDGLVDYILKTNSIIPLGSVSSITGIDEGTIVSGLRDILSSYPERSMEGKYLHFIFYERCPKWHFQGEDRNRIFLRHVAPFYASSVFEYCMRLPASFKRHFRLYREVLTKLSPAVASIPNPEWGFPITSSRLPLYCLARMVYFHMPEGIRRMIARNKRYSKTASVYEDGAPVMRSLHSQLENSDRARRLLSVSAIDENLCRLDKTGFDHLYTLTSVIEFVDRGKSSIEEYAEAELL